MNRSGNKRPKRYGITVLHQRAGLIAGPLVLILALSGILLNHTDTLKLDHRHVDFKPLLFWYGIKPPANPLHFKSDEHVISQLGEQVFLSSRPTFMHQEKLRGAVLTGVFTVLAFQQELMLLTHDGDLVERITEIPGRSGDITAIGIHDNNIVLEAAQQCFMADRDLISWSNCSDDLVVDWSLPVKMDQKYEHGLDKSYKHHELSYERVLLDLHSGRLLGHWGLYMMDISALLMAFLTLSGFWRWLCRRNQ